MNQRESESIGMPRAAARRTVRRPQLGVERLESRAMLTSIYPVPDWGGVLPESLPVEVDELDVTAFVEEVAWDEPIWILPDPGDYPVEADDPEAATPEEDLSDEPVTEPVPQPPLEGDGSTPVPDGDKGRMSFCDIFFRPTIGSIRYRAATLADGRSLDFFAGIYEGDDVEAVLADVLGRLRPGILGTEVTKVFVSIPDGQGGRLEYELDYSKSGEPESTVGDTPAEPPPVTESDPIESFDTDTAATESETDWTESDWTETDADWVEPETSLAEPDNVEHDCVPELPADDLTGSFGEELLRSSLVFAPTSVVVRPTVVRLDALSLRSPAAAYFAALAGLPSQVSESAGVTAVGAKRRGR